MCNFRITRLAILLLLTISVSSMLPGCAAIHTSIAKKDMKVNSKMSDTVFLDPVGPKQRTIFLDVRNTTDKPGIELLNSIRASLESKGYSVSSNPDAAHFWLRANVLNISEASPTAAENVLGQGYGGALGGIALGGAIGSVGGYAGSGIGGLAGGLAGALVETVANAAVKDVTYMVVTDVEIAEKTGEAIRQTSRQDAKQGGSGAIYQTSSNITDRKRYRVRVVSTANQVNLVYEEAVPELIQGLARTISGVF